MFEFFERPFLLRLIVFFYIIFSYPLCYYLQHIVLINRCKFVS